MTRRRSRARAIARIVPVSETRPRLSMKARSAGVDLAMDQSELEIAAKDHAALARQSVGQAAGQRTDSGNRRHAERDASDENVKAAQTAAQFAQRQPQR